MTETIIKTDRKQEAQPSIETPVIEAPETEVKTPMEPSTGGKGTMTQKQMITMFAIIVVIVVVIVLAVYFYNKYKKSPLTVPQ